MVFRLGLQLCTSIASSSQSKSQTASHCCLATWQRMHHCPLSEPHTCKTSSMSVIQQAKPITVQLGAVPKPLAQSNRARCLRLGDFDLGFNPAHIVEDSFSALL